MDLSSAGSSRPSTDPDVNLYCSECQAQIGIFRNEWIRLTSSYARSKTRGKHFGTEIGDRTQVVPPGPLQRSAEGCEMAQVLCCKCSNVVGQYCKSAPDSSQKALVNQYFYKLSRTFLKNNNTKIREQPVFVYSPDIHELGLGLKSNDEARDSMTPMSRWMNTPLRDASSTPSVQTATRSVLRNDHFPAASRREPVTGSAGRADGYVSNVPDTERLDQELGAQNSMLREHSSRLSNQASQCADHEGRLRDHHARIEDQERCVRAQATRILEQDDTIESQKGRIEQQDAQIRLITHQLINFQKTLEDMQNTIKVIRSDRVTEQFSTIGQANFVDNFELMVRVMRDAQSSAQEIENLRSHNQDLQSRLTKVHSAMGTTEAENVEYELPTDKATHASSILGKRKRISFADRAPSIRSEESLQAKDRRVVRFEDRASEQPVTTSQSYGNEDQQIRDATGSESNIFCPASQTLPNRDTSHEIPVDAPFDRTSAAIARSRYLADKAEQVMNPAIPGRHENRDDNQLQIVESSTLANFAEAENVLIDQEMNDSTEELTVDQSQYAAATPQRTLSGTLKDRPAGTSQTKSQNTSEVGHDPRMATDNTAAPILSNLSDDDDYVPPVEYDSPPPESEQPAQTAHEDDLSAFDDNIDFSSDDAYVEPTTTRKQPRKLSHRRVTELWNSREARSMAPEPGKKRRKTMPASTGPKLLTLDRVRLATPQMFREAISKGEGPKAARPPRINTRQENLHKELRELGLEEWITKDKKCKEYRDIVAKARAESREAKKVKFLRENGIDYASSSKSALSTLRNVRASSAGRVEAAPGSENHEPDKAAAPEDTMQGSPEESRLTRSRTRHSGDSIHVGMEYPELGHDLAHLQASEHEHDTARVLEAEPEASIEAGAAVKKPNKRGRPPGKATRRRKSAPRSSVSHPGSDQLQTPEESAQQKIPAVSVDVDAKFQRIDNADTQAQAEQAPDAKSASSASTAGSYQNEVAHDSPNSDIEDDTIETLMAQYASKSQASSSSALGGYRKSLEPRVTSRQMTTEDLVAARDRMAMEAMERDD